MHKEKPKCPGKERQAAETEESVRRRKIKKKSTKENRAGT
jgi:hypothetical protein